MASVLTLVRMLSLAGYASAMQLTTRASNTTAPTPAATPSPPTPQCAKPNERPQIVPPTGVFRGSTNILGVDFESWFGPHLHIMRLFPETPYTITDSQMGFAAAGGILFLTPQPENWSTYETSNIEALANISKSVAPSQVMIAVGFEPNGHCSETATNDDEIYGTAAEWVALQQRVVQTFASMNVTNAVFAIDFSTAFAMNFDPAAHILWPGDDYVDVLLFNVFQNQSTTDCRTIIEMVYSQLEQASASGYNYTSKPWGLGAWGSFDVNDDNPPQAIPLSDRETCYSGVQSVFSSGDYPRLKYSIYYNSDTSIIQPANTSNPNFADGYNNTPQLVPSYKNVVNLDVFNVNDCYYGYAGDVRGEGY